MAFGKLFSSAKKIPVLAYDAGASACRVGVERWRTQLSAHLAYIRNEGYQAMSLGTFLDVARAGKPAPDKALLLTFDGAAALAEVQDLLLSHSLQAAAFISAKDIDSNLPEILKQHADGPIQLAMGGLDSDDYSTMPLPEIKESLEMMTAMFKRSGLRYQKVLAFPGGRLPKDRMDLILLKSLMADAGIEAAFRLDGKLSRMPAVDFYELSRIYCSVSLPLSLSE